MKKNILSMAALLMASATMFTACSSSDDSIISENQQPVQTTGKYTMTVQASKGGDATTRALTLDETTSPHKLNATWATTENVYVKKGSDWATGSLKPQADGATATLKGTLSDVTINANDVLTLQFPKSGDISYDGQVGTLEDIAANFDYATATVTVASVSASGNIVPTAATTTFENHQAIVKFTLKDKDDAAISAKKLVINDGTTDYTITPASNTSVIYAAIPGFTGQTVTLTATVGSDTYTYEKTGVSFTNSQFYEITVKMTKQAAPATPLDNTTTAWTAGSYAVPAGGLTYSGAITVSGDVTLVLTDGETLTLNKGISLAEGATLTIQGNGTMNVNGTNSSTASTVAGPGTLVLTSGTLTAKGGNGAGYGDNEMQSGGSRFAGGVAINGAVTVSGGTLTATGGAGGSIGSMNSNVTAGAGGAAISGSVTLSSGTLTATGGNGGNGGQFSDGNAGAGGAAIGGDLTVNGGTMTTTNGSNGVVTVAPTSVNLGAGGKAVAGTVTDNR